LIFLFFTKTNWNEPNRLRHDLAILLQKNGNEILFFQRPIYFFQKKNETETLINYITLFQTRQLIHHKLRLFYIFRQLNSLYERYSIKKELRKKNIQKVDYIINFNYDYYFISNVIESKKIITIINDDFWSDALFNYQKPLLSVLNKTLQNSAHIITVSKVLYNSINTSTPKSILYPWCFQQYSKPKVSKNRNDIFFWGYVNNRIDTKFLTELALKLEKNNIDIKIHIYGPVSINKDIFKSNSNIILSGTCDLDDISFENYFCSIIPYKHGIKNIDVITFPNKLLKITSRGIPIAITGMPNFIDLPFVFRLDDIHIDPVIRLIEIQKKFDIVQPDIVSFLNDNSPDNRMNQLLSIFQ
jgi:hypothetical protein